VLEAHQARSRPKGETPADSPATSRKQRVFDHVTEAVGTTCQPANQAPPTVPNGKTATRRTTRTILTACGTMPPWNYTTDLATRTRLKYTANRRERKPSRMTMKLTKSSSAHARRYLLAFREAFSRSQREHLATGPALFAMDEPPRGSRCATAALESRRAVSARPESPIAGGIVPAVRV